MVLSSSEEILSAFMFFYHKDPAALIDWTLGQQAFNSCMILLFDAIESRRVTFGIRKVEQAFVVFKELDDNDVHKLAGLAVEKISQALVELHKIVAPQPTFRSMATHDQQRSFDENREADKSEAPHGLQSVDTVMGNTGMSLLEDPGLQAFVQEAFNPLAWSMPDHQNRNSGRTENLFPQDVKFMNKTGPEISSNDLYDFRSAGGMQDTRTSKTTRSTPSRYATSAEDDLQLHSHTTPAPHTGLESPLHRDLQTVPKSIRQGLAAARQPPADLRHQQIAQNYQAISTLEPMDNDNWAFGSGLSMSDRVYQPQDDQTVSQHPHFISHASRHNSCPSIPRIPVDPPLLRPTYSSPSTINRHNMMQSTHETPLRAHVPATTTVNLAVTQAYVSNLPTSAIDHDLYSSSTGRIAVSMSNIPEAGSDVAAIASGPRVDSVFPTLQAYRGEQGAAYSFPTQFPHETPSTITPLAEEMSLNEWRRYVGSSGTQ